MIDDNTGEFEIYSGPIRNVEFDNGNIFIHMAKNEHQYIIFPVYVIKPEEYMKYYKYIFTDRGIRFEGQSEVQKLKSSTEQEFLLVAGVL